MKGRVAKKAHHDKNVLTTNTAVLYLDLDAEEECTPVSKSDVPAYLTKPAPTTLGLDELHKHAMISDIEKNRAVRRMAEKFITLVPALQNILRSKDPTESKANSNDHSYQTGDA